MRRWLATFALVSAAAPAQQAQLDSPSPLDPTRAKALDNALRGFKFRDRFRSAREPVVPGGGDCSIPLLEAAMDPKIDRGMLRVAPKNLPMPVARGLPPCKGVK